MSGMKRRTLLAGSAAALASVPLARPRAQRPATIRWWYHFDDPTASPAELIASFEKLHPAIKIQAESIPWGGGSDYDTRLYTSLIAGNAPDCAMVKFYNLPRLLEMEALEPLDGRIAAWQARGDIADDLWKLHLAADGRRYYLPLMYVILYLYVRQDWLAGKGLTAPANFEEFLAAAEALTGGERWGFGLRGGPGGHDHWASFVLGDGAKLVEGGLVTPEALAANRWFIDLYRVHHVFPPSAPADGFVQTIANMKAGRTAMTIHHVGSANEIVAVLGERITAVPVPHGTHGKGWTSFGDQSNAIFAASANKDAAWTWTSFLSTAAANAAIARLAGQLPVTTSSAATWNAQPRRFIDASMASLPMAGLMPATPQTTDFTRTIWPQTTQKALLGEISSDEMMRIFEKHFFG